jgi:hypothetical protein
MKLMDSAARSRPYQAEQPAGNLIFYFFTGKKQEKKRVSGV